MDASLATEPWAPPFAPGDPAPWFSTPSPSNPNFHFNTTAGRYLLLGFLPPSGPGREAAFAALEASRAHFDDANLAAFVVIRDAESIAKARNWSVGLRWLFDADGEVSRLYGALDPAGRETPFWLLLDPMLRVLCAFPIAEGAALLSAIERLAPLDAHAGVELNAPVLIAPRIFEPDLCERLIALYEADGGAPSGVMRDVDGRTVGVLDDFKRRRDFTISDPALKQELLMRIRRRLIPEVTKVFQFRATRIERYIVACYDAADGGYFRPHRDNESLGTAHRKFACSINLNAEGFEGGDLRFPEFGRRTYRPPTGGAVVFACGLQHEATPVTRGRRYAFLPFLYDEAGQQVREANQAALAPPGTPPAGEDPVP
ncbi:2OG-Fe(II) oxygenase [Phenylobacterium sp.]|uniref:2OG-Fe(II) oxygenase n=1 Tax=Phenylobacterium sp. TaxID=1871053 RepID=UPI0035646F71